MNCNVNILKKAIPAILVCLVLGSHVTYGQEETAPADISFSTPFHNQLFFNRFLINPTFSLVRENKSYLNILHRNQYASFEDNTQNYYLGFSNRMNEKTALGIGVYGQWEGIMQEFGFNANYATSVRLSTNSKLTFGTNITYLSRGINKNNVIVAENDPTLQESRKENQIAVQPGIALSLGKFDVGLYATDLIKYNQTTNNLVTNLNDKSVKAALQYTHTFSATRGLFADARLMPLLQVGKNQDESLSYIGSVVLDLPNYGWLQTTYDDTYGMSLGVGFNINQQLSLGYLLEKNLTEEGANLGWNHELSLAYTFKDNLLDSSGTYVGNSAKQSADKRVDEVVRNYEEQILQLKSENAKAMAGNNTSNDTDQNALAYENRLILDELILRQDSIDKARNSMLEKKFETMVRLLRNEVRQNGNPKIQKEPISTQYETAVASVEFDEDKLNSYIKRAEPKEYIKIPIKSQNRSDIIGVESGYYLIVNVYKNKRYLNAFIDSLNEQGLNAKQFYNKENGLYYVYLADFKMKTEAETAIVSNLNGKYQEEKWIMQVYNDTATAEVVFED